MKPSAYKIWYPGGQRFIQGTADDVDTYIYLEYTGMDDSAGVPLYNGDIIRSEHGIGTIELVGTEWVVHLLGHDKQPLDIQREREWLGSKYTHLPNGTLIDM